MNHRKQGLRLSGLLLVVALGVMAFAASAQAVTPTFLVGGVSGTTLPATIGATQEGTGTMTVPELKFKLNCTAFTVDEGKVNSGSDAKAILLYTGCTTLDLVGGEIACEVHGLGGVPIKAEALLLPTETTAGVAAVLAENIKALVFLTKVGDLTKPCVLPEDNVVTGTVCFEISANNNTKEPLIKTEDASTKCTAADALKYGTQPVTLKGSATLFGLLEHKEKTLGVSLI
jgi:hypothetical protein